MNTSVLEEWILVFVAPLAVASSACKTVFVSNTEKEMKAGRRPSAFIVSRCLEPLMKHEARVFEVASQTSVKISWNFFRRIGHQKV